MGTARSMPACLAGIVAILTIVPPVGVADTYRSPIELRYAPDGSAVAVSDYTAGRLVIFTPDGKQAAEIPLRGEPAGIAWHPDGSRIYVAERGAWSVAEINPQTRKVTQRFEVGRYPVGLAASSGHLVVADYGVNQVSIFDLQTGARAQIDSIHRPWEVALAPDGQLAIVGSLLPGGDARREDMGSVVTLIEIASARKAATIALPPGSINVHGLTVAPDGKWAYVVHSIGRFTLPTTQLERGWVMTHAMSIIDLTTRELTCTVLLDHLMEGAADPWGVTVSPDGKSVCVALAGVHQVARVDVESLHAMLAGTLPAHLAGKLPANSIWHKVVKDPTQRRDLVNDLSALYGADMIHRADIGAKGPRGIAFAPDGKTLAVAAYFGGKLVLVDAANLSVRARIEMGAQPAATAERIGEQHFFDANLCFQRWLSCASCHPEGRADGLNWDLLNDGMGNPKNTKSLVLSHRTPPVMSTGVRPSMEIATEKGFTFIQFRAVEESAMDAVRAYLRALRPEPSPYLIRSDKPMDCGVCHYAPTTQKPGPKHMAINGALSDEAKKGMALFKSEKVGCARCHPGPLFTDLKSYDVGTRHELDRRSDFDTPTCYEMWRTAPFLHDGSASTMMEMLTIRNEDDKHGVTSILSDEDKRALEAYLKSL